jgi:hypothetical protein
MDPQKLPFCRRNNFLEAVLRPTGVLRLSEAVEEKPWVSVTICIMFALAVATGGLPGKYD